MTVSAHAAEYKPGTVGYQYNQCGFALQDSDSPLALYETQCGAFTEGFVAGLMAVNGIRLPPPRSGDPCAGEKQKEYERINARFCENLPDYDQKKVEAGRALDTATGLVTNWIAYLLEQKKKRKGDPLKKPTAEGLAQMLQPGEFCEYLKTAVPPEKKFVVHPSLLKISWNDVMAIKDSMTVMRKYEQCLRDLESSGHDFAGTRCGAEIMGFIAGINSTAHLQEGREKPSGSCGKEIDRLYRSLDAKQSMCVSPETDPRRVAELFVSQIEGGRKGNEKSDAFGAIGYQTIYKGFLCIKN